jgi:hypothetical protein
MKELKSERRQTIMENEHPQNMENMKEFGALKLNPRVIEAWINNTLKDAETLDIPGIIAKNESK